MIPRWWKDPLTEEVEAAVANHYIVFGSGITGAGKTTRSPCSLVALNRGTDLATTGIAHVMPMKLAALSVRSHYWKNP